jgi:class 3 adenylate cyclase/pimeloyl-ACP methyl ester carboxylesterase
VELPETHYARSGDLSIAYQVLGEGPPDIVYIPGGFHHVELSWQIDRSAQLYRRLASISRLLRFDKRGTGMSDRIAEAAPLETRMDDIRAVMDAAGCAQAVLFGTGDGGQLGCLFAATYPERSAALVLFNATPRLTRSPDMPWLRTRAEIERVIREISDRWGDLQAMAEGSKSVIPSATDEELLQQARISRLSHSPAAAAMYMRANLDVDVRDVLPSIRVPTLVMYRADGHAPFGLEPSGRYLAEHIRGARLVALPGADFPPPWGDQGRLLKELERFLRDAAQGRVEAEEERVLATVLFTDIVDATARASELGDRAWRELLVKHHEMIRSQLGFFRGKEIDTTGDGFFATFDGPARAIRCACAIRDGVRDIGLRVRVGLHTGECELVDGKVGGIAVHIGARVASLAQPDEVLVSRTVKDLVAGSGIALVDRGEHPLKGVPGEWHLYSVALSERQPDSDTGIVRGN